MKPKEETKKQKVREEKHNEKVVISNPIEECSRDKGMIICI